MAHIHGTFEPAFAGVADALSEQIDAGEELGGSIVVDIDGDIAVDIWGGAANAESGAPWERDTIVNVWSTTKTVTNLAALICHERGLLDVYAPVAEYWPEFAANGKEKVAVRHLLSHTSGVPGFDQPGLVDDLYDWERATSRFAAQAPWWEPGTASGYHALNQGHLVGEVVRRVSGKSLKQFVKDEIADPLGADFQIGAIESDWSRIAPVIPPPPLSLEGIDPESIAVRTFTSPFADANAANTPEWRRADIGAANGHGNARSVARILSVISRGGTVDGVTLLSPKTIDLIFDQQSNGIDYVLGVPVTFGIGYGLANQTMIPYFPADTRLAFWGGWGGSVILMDLDRKVTVSYMMNKMGPGVVGSDRAEKYVTAIYQSLDKDA